MTEYTSSVNADIRNNFIEYLPGAHTIAKPNRNVKIISDWVAEYFIYCFPTPYNIKPNRKEKIISDYGIGF